MDWKMKLNEAVRNAKIEIIGKDDVKNEAQAKAACSIIKAYGDSSAGFIYLEPCNVKSAKRPQDLFLCHPDVGMMFVEVKGWVVDNIQRVVSGKFILETGGMSIQKSSVGQVTEAMYCVVDLLNRKLKKRHKVPITDFLVAFPNT